jgi:hypothetical protein
MLEPNAVKVTTNFPMYANESTLHPFEMWRWWSKGIVTIGAEHQFFTREREDEEPAYERCVTMILWTDEQLAELETFLREAHEQVGRPVYFEAMNVHVRPI